MRTLNYKTEYQKLLSPEIVSYLAQIHEMKGQQNLFVEAQKDALYRMVAESFQNAFAGTLGWFYWSWKILAEGLDADCDDACRCVTKGWLELKNT